ncbi:MAG: peptidyl-prolyl cis-trans isomerase [Candidatus Omnitrophica bacterium]|jgi:parvulin-like peptidyl-prolyl isomerase|nr:peptidyl-prolyl cis-trans isomerase [Candidatus Omnitrophota bacterium]MDD5078885.1 peptidyl-prolyl cis-trans isomerase [Candidatus Omnitrophota bacterium]
MSARDLFLKSALTVISLSVLISPAAAQDKIVAVVGNEVITQTDLDNFVNFTRIQMADKLSGSQLEEKITGMKAGLLQRLIEDKLILQEAKKNGVRADESRVNSRITEIKRRYPSEKHFRSALAEDGMVEANLVTKIRDQMLMYNIIDSKVRSKIVVNPVEITDFYNRNMSLFKTREERKFQSLLFESQDLAKSVYKQLKDGLDINEAAKKYSLTLSDLDARKTELRKEIEDVLFNLQVGEISQPVANLGKFYLLKLSAIIPPRQQTLAEVREQINNSLLERKMQEALVKWVDGLKKTAYIKIMP